MVGVSDYKRMLRDAEERIQKYKAMTPAELGKLTPRELETKKFMITNDLKGIVDMLYFQYKKCLEEGDPCDGLKPFIKFFEEYKNISSPGLNKSLQRFKTLLPNKVLGNKMTAETALRITRGLFEDASDKFINSKETNSRIYGLLARELLKTLNDYEYNLVFLTKMEHANINFIRENIIILEKIKFRISIFKEDKQIEERIQKVIENVLQIIKLSGNNKMNTSKISKLQALVRAKQNVQSRYVNALLNDMRREQDFDYYINKINKVYKKIPEVLKQKTISKNNITTQIAPCHIRPGQTPVVYLRQLRNQLLFAAKLYHKKKVQEPEFAKRFLDRLKGELGGRPCLENLIEGLSVALSDPEFVWKGRNIKDPIMGLNNKKYLNVLMKAVVSFQEHHAGNNKAAPLPMSLNRRKQLFWNMIKNKNLFVTNGRNIGYTQVKKYNRNGNRFKASNAAELLEYINRKNAGPNLFRRKIAVRRIESAYKKKKESRRRPIRRMLNLPPLIIQRNPFVNNARLHAPKANNGKARRLAERVRIENEAARRNPNLRANMMARINQQIRNNPGNQALIERRNRMARMRNIVEANEEKRQANRLAEMIAEQRAAEQRGRNRMAAIQANRNRLAARIEPPRRNVGGGAARGGPPNMRLIMMNQLAQVNQQLRNNPGNQALLRRRNHLMRLAGPRR